jgi:hypothetical protein
MKHEILGEDLGDDVGCVEHDEQELSVALDLAVSAKFTPYLNLGFSADEIEDMRQGIFVDYVSGSIDE